MRHSVKMPKLGDTDDEVFVIEWLVETGSQVTAGQPVLRIETNKVDMDVVSPVEGLVVDRLVSAGDAVRVGTPILVVDDG